MQTWDRAILLGKICSHFTLREVQHLYFGQEVTYLVELTQWSWAVNRLVNKLSPEQPSFLALFFG